MEFLNYIDIKGISTNVITYIILGFIAIIVVFFREKIFKFNKKPESNPQGIPRAESVKSEQITTENYSSETNEPERTDEERRVILISKLEELEQQLSVFKKVLHKTRISSINTEQPHK